MDSSNTTSHSHTIAPENNNLTLQKMAQTSHNSAAVDDLPSAAAFRHRRRKTHSQESCNGGGGEEKLMDEKAEVEKKIVALQKIVPGGERLPVEELFEETAEYILELQCQVKMLRFLAAFVQGSEKTKRMLGG